VKVKNREYFRRNILNPLISCGKLELSIPDKSHSKNQKYFAKDKNISKFSLQQGTMHDTMQDKIEKILLFCRVSRTRLEIQKHVKVKI
jgi:hypothetical protein